MPRFIRSQLRFALGLALGCAVPLPAASQPLPRASVPGTARIGATERAVQMHFACAATGREPQILIASMDLVDAETLQPGFDVNPFEGPDGIGARSRLVATGKAGEARAEFKANGSFGADGAPGTSFGFSTNPASGPGRQDRDAFQKLQGVLRTLVAGEGRLSWRVENAALHGAPLEATAVVSEAQAASLRTIVSPCLGGPTAPGGTRR